MNRTIVPGANPNNYVIGRKRKLYRFAAFANLANCYDTSGWIKNRQSFLDQRRPLTVEIGAGSALFLVRLAELNPRRSFIAIDRKSDRLFRGAKLATEKSLVNIVFVWSRANNLTSLLPVQSVDTIWITFPDPWPQDSNIKHRLTNPRLLEQYHKLLTPNGELNFKTDNRALFDWSISQFKAKLWQVKLITNDLHVDDSCPDEARFMTTYEESYVDGGRKINYLLVGKL